MTMHRENIKGAVPLNGIDNNRRSGDIFPAWDWLRVPGVTLPHVEPPWAPEARGVSEWAGGVSDGKFGMASLDLIRYTQLRPGGDELDEETTLTAKKAWFFFDREVVVLGSGVATTFDKAPVFTSVNQCLLNGTVHCADASGNCEISGGDAVLRGPATVWHDNIAYFFPEQQSPVHVSTKEQSGTWHSISHERSDEMVTREVFSVGLEHGKQPSGVNYCYFFVPDVQPEEIEDWMRTQMPQVVSNDAALQAVWQSRDRTGMAAFHRPGMVHFGGYAVEVDTACLVLLSVERTCIKIAVSDPRAQGRSVRVKIHASTSGKNCGSCGGRKTYSFSIDLPSEPANAGRPVMREIATAEQ